MAQTHQVNNSITLNGITNEKNQSEVSNLCVYVM